MKLVATTLVALLVGCKGEVYTAAHGRVLCDPQSTEAFYVKGIGFGNAEVKREPRFDAPMCAKGVDR